MSVCTCIEPQIRLFGGYVAFNGVTRNSIGVLGNRNTFDTTNYTHASTSCEPQFIFRAHVVTRYLRIGGNNIEVTVVIIEQ